MLYFQAKKKKAQKNFELKSEINKINNKFVTEQAHKKPNNIIGTLKGHKKNLWI